MANAKKVEIEWQNELTTQSCRLKENQRRDKKTINITLAGTVDIE